MPFALSVMLVLVWLGGLTACAPLSRAWAESAPSPPSPASSGDAARPGADPSLNRPYRDADIQRWTDIFESPGREVFDRRFQIVHAARVRPGMRIADIGAGTGLFTVLFARAVGPEGRVYAVDISPGFVAGIEERARAFRVENVVPVLNTQQTTGLESESIDLAFLCDTYHHFEDPQAMLSSIHQALVPYGSLMVVDFKRVPGLGGPWVMSHVRAGRDEVVSEIEAAGFRLVEEPEILKRNYLLRFERVSDEPDMEVGPPETVPTAR